MIVFRESNALIAGWSTILMSLSPQLQKRLGIREGITNQEVMSLLDNYGVTFEKGMSAAWNSQLELLVVKNHNYQQTRLRGVLGLIEDGFEIKKPPNHRLEAAVMPAGRASVPEPLARESPFIYPNSEFVSQTNITAWVGLESIGIANRADYVRVMSNILTDLDIFEAQESVALENDPFITTPDQPCVTFRTFDPAEAVAQYYEARFPEYGWRKFRDILLLEFCTSGGYWARVYQKGDALVHLRMTEAWEPDIDGERGAAEGARIVRSIIFRFIRIEPSEILGAGYRDKKLSDPASLSGDTR